MRQLLVAAAVVAACLCSGYTQSWMDGPNAPFGHQRWVRAAAARARQTPEGRLKVIRQSADEVVLDPEQRLDGVHTFAAPDGHSLVWVNAGGIRLLSLPDGAWRQLVLADEAFPHDASSSLLPRDVPEPRLLRMSHFLPNYHAAGPISRTGRYLAYYALTGGGMLDLQSGRAIVHPKTNWPPLLKAFQWRGDDQWWAYSEVDGCWYWKPGRKPAAPWQRTDLTRPGLWSPDGGRLLAWQWAGTGTEAVLQITDEAGEVLHELRGVNAVELEWSPSGRYVSGLFVPRDVKHPEALPIEPTRGFIWDPENGDLMSPLSRPVVPPPRDEARWPRNWGAVEGAIGPVPAETVPILSERALAWNAGSTRVAFLARAAERDPISIGDIKENLVAPETEYRLMLYDLPSHEVHEVAAAATRMMRPVWLNDGRELVYASPVSSPDEREFPFSELTWRRLPESLLER